MKSLNLLSILILVVISIMSCKKSSTAYINASNGSTGNGNTNGSVEFDITKATLLKQGTFVGTPSHNVSGTVGLYEFEGKKYLHLQNFSTTGGPDLRVYISTTTTATQFVSLGLLKSNSGPQSYLITNPPDFNTYNKVLIWCQQFSVLFGASTIQ